MTLETVWKADWTADYELVVVNTRTGETWYPNESAALEISVADDPPSKAIQICRGQPARGKWTY